MTNLVTDVANQSLDAIGFDVVLSDIEDGTREAQILLRAYGQCLRQLLRAAHWNFARRTAPLTLLADATGSTPNVGTTVPAPWIYEYAWPIDCMKARFVPANPHGVSPSIPPGNLVAPGVGLPFLGGPQASPLYRQHNHPARFVVATDINYPPLEGQQTWEIQGQSPAGVTVVLTNVRCATLIYTALILYPSLWDANFREAMVAYLASQVALPIWAKKDRKFGLEMRAQQIAIAKQKITEARASDGNEGWFSSDIRVDWLDFRRAGGGFGYGMGYDSVGVLGYGWDALGFGDGASAY